MLAGLQFSLLASRQKMTASVQAACISRRSNRPLQLFGCAAEVQCLPRSGTSQVHIPNLQRPRRFIAQCVSFAFTLPLRPSIPLASDCRALCQRRCSTLSLETPLTGSSSIGTLRSLMVQHLKRTPKYRCFAEVIQQSDCRSTRPAGLTPHAKLLCRQAGFDFGMEGPRDGYLLAGGQRRILSKEQSFQESAVGFCRNTWSAASPMRGSIPFERLPCRSQSKAVPSSPRFSSKAPASAAMIQSHVRSKAVIVKSINPVSSQSSPRSSNSKEGAMPTHHLREQAGLSPAGSNGAISTSRSLRRTAQSPLKVQHGRWLSTSHPAPASQSAQQPGEPVDMVGSQSAGQQMTTPVQGNLSRPWVADFPRWLDEVQEMPPYRRPQPMVVVFDIETSGLSMKLNRIVEFAARDAQGEPGLRMPQPRCLWRLNAALVVLPLEDTPPISVSHGLW
jgi:hypothetical protein